MNIRAQLKLFFFKVPISCLGILHICNLWILLRKIVIYLVGWKCYLRGIFWLLKSTEMTSTQESVSLLQDVLMYKRAMNLRISVHFHQMVTIRLRIKWYIFSMWKTECFHYNTDSWVDVTSITFKSKYVHEDNIFDRQDILQFFSGVSKDYKYAKSPNMR